MDQFKDFYPYPWTWSKNWTQSVDDWLDILDSVYELIDPWTYENHWRHSMDDPAPDYWRWCVDLYWAGTWPRSQMPPDQGDEIAEFIVANMAQHIRIMIWFHNQWTPADGWEHYSGPQGDFVDHIHIEFDSEGMINA